MSVILNINSENWCRRAYLNYHCYGNTMGLTPEQMGQITQTWADRLPSWKESVSSDQVEYEFDDSDYAAYKDKGKNAAQDVTGEVNNAGSIVHTAGNAASSIAGATMTTLGAVGGKAVEGIAGATVEACTLTGKAAGKVASKITETTGNVVGEGAKSASATAFIVGCCLSAATAIAYWIKQPNKEEKEACDALMPEMAGAQGALQQTQDDMANAANEIITKSDEAEEANEEANSQIEEKKTEYDMYMQTYQALQAKVDSNIALTESEKQLYKSIVGYLEETGGMIDEISSEATDTVSNLYEEIEGYQSTYDDAASSMAEVEGLTDYAASFDKTTQVMCYVEGGAQTLNAASGAIAGGQAAAFAASGAALFGSTAWAFVFAAMGFAAAASSGASASQQFTWAGEVGGEIDARELTQDLNTGTMEIYEEELDGFAGALEGVSALDLEIPDDVEAPTASANITDNANPSESTANLTSEKTPKKKE